jgi:polyphosphate kinase
LRDEILESYLRDDVKARLLQPDGSYIRAARAGHGLSAQDWLMELSRDPTRQLGAPKPEAPPAAQEDEHLEASAQSAL